MTLNEELKKKCNYKYQYNLGQPSVCSNGLCVQISFDKHDKEGDTFLCNKDNIMQVVFNYTVINPTTALELAQELQDYAMYCIEEYSKNPYYCVCCDGEIFRNDDGTFDIMTLEEAQKLQKDMMLVASENKWTVRPLSYNEFYNELSEN